MSARLFIMHAPSLPEDCLHNGDLLSASSGSNSLTVAQVFVAMHY